MFMVVSKWEPKSGMEEDFKANSSKVRNAMRGVPGVVLMESFWSDTGGCAVMGYESRDAYDRIVNDPNGPFARIIAEHDLEKSGTWIWSERGETVED